MRLRWPVETWRCDECRALHVELRKPWYTPRKLTPREEEIRAATLQAFALLNAPPTPWVVSTYYDPLSEGAVIRIPRVNIDEAL